jgi:hypothetical protein
MNFQIEQKICYINTNNGLPAPIYKTLVNQNISYIQMTSTNKNIDQISDEAKSSTEDQLMPKWQDIAKAIKEIVIVADYCGKPRDGKFMQGYKKQYRNLFNTEEPDEYIVEYAKNRFPNKEKYMEMKEQYKQWYRFEPRLLKAIEDLNRLYYKLAKPHFKDLTKIRSEIGNFLDNNEIDNIDEFLSEN